MFSIPLHPRRYILSAYLFMILMFSLLCGVIVMDIYQTNKMRVILQSHQSTVSLHREHANRIIDKQRAKSARQKNDNIQSLAGLHSLSRAWKDDIAIISLQQDSARHHIELSVDAKNLTAFLDFTHRLRSEVKDVNILQHQEKKDSVWLITGTLNIGYTL